MSRIIPSLFFMLFIFQQKIIDIEANSCKEPYRLDLIHFNDFHARFEETSLETPICRTNDSRCLGGFPRLYHEITLLKEEKPEALLLNAGDSLQGTYWHTLFQWNLTQEFMNLLPLDAHAIGNHDFDVGPQSLALYLGSLKAPVLAANMDASDEPSLQGLYQPHIVIERYSRKIGIIGLITTDTELFSHAGKVKITDPKEAVEREIKVLTEQGVDIIVVLSHCGYEMDKQLAHEFGQYIDVIVGGHTHRSEIILRPYPTFVKSSSDKNHMVLVVHASAFTKYVGNISIYFDCDGNYINWDGGMIFLNRSVPEDLILREMLEPYAKLVHVAEASPIGGTFTALQFEDCEFGECALGDMLTDAFNELAKETVKSEHKYLSFAQRDYMTATIPKGTITHGHLIQLLPYYDQIETFLLQGEHILEALEQSVSDAWDYDPFKGPWMLQVSGLKISYNITRPEGERVTSVVIGDNNIPIDTKEFYQVTAPGYLADGGDGITWVMFKKHKKNMKVIGHDQNVLKYYIKKHSPLNIKTEGRVTINS